MLDNLTAIFEFFGRHIGLEANFRVKQKLLSKSTEKTLTEKRHLPRLDLSKNCLA
jgi:hypothetical protein